MGYHFGLSGDEIEGLDDDSFIELAAQAYFLEERSIDAVKIGVLRALAEIFKKT